MSAISHFWASCTDLSRLPQSVLKRAFHNAVMIGFRLGILAGRLSSKAPALPFSITDLSTDQVDELAWELEVLAAESQPVEKKVVLPRDDQDPEPYPGLGPK